MCLSPDNHGFAGQEIQVGASDRDQAGITYQMVDRMINLDDRFGIASKFRMTPSSKRLQHKTTLTQLRCLSSDAYRHHGGGPAVVLLDECANISSAQAEEFYSVLTTGFAAQKEPLTLMFSTQAPNDQHFFSRFADRAKAINEGKLDPTTFAGFVYEVPETDAEGEPVDPFDESWWYLGAPGLQAGIADIADIRDWAQKAKEMPNLSQKFQLLKLNRRVSETAGFVSRVVWQENENPCPPPEELYGRTCWLGLDLSETTDLTAMVALFEPASPQEHMPVHPYFWIPGGDLQMRVKRDHVPYDVWAEQGLVDVKSAKTVDYGRVADKIIEYLQNYEVMGIGFDRYRIKYLIAALKEKGYEWPEESNFLYPIGQGFIDQTRSLDVLQELLLNKRLATNKNPILRWNMSNMVVVRDPANNMKANKARSYGRIDGGIALALAAHVRADFGLLSSDPAFDVAAIVG
jgi:phage terminase large subunit-like protein